LRILTDDISVDEMKTTGSVEIYKIFYHWYFPQYIDEIAIYSSSYDHARIIEYYSTDGISWTTDSMSAYGNIVYVKLMLISDDSVASIRIDQFDFSSGNYLYSSQEPILFSILGFFGLIKFFGMMVTPAFIILSVKKQWNLENKFLSIHTGIMFMTIFFVLFIISISAG